MENLSRNILDRFVRYAKVDTMSDDHMQGIKFPSTDGQWDLLHMLESELKELGIKDVSLDEHGYLVARIPGNVKAPAICFMAHVDTADDVMGNGVRPVVIEKFDGKDITLPATGAKIKVAENPQLLQYVGETIITSSGDTLLGADDKAGVAEIMALAETLMTHPEIRHGEVEILFSGDEEIGAGMDYFDPKRLHAVCCYTVDGNGRYEVEAECFNAVTSKLHFSGVSAHLGAARGKMVSSIAMANKFISMLPDSESPEATDNRYGYYCPLEINGTAVELDLVLYLRDFNYENLLRRMDVVEKVAEAVRACYPGGKVSVDQKIIYKNMAEATKKRPEVMRAIMESAEKLGFTPIEKIIRGGTDGARLAEQGLPAPNIFTGGHNLHSLFEWAALPAMTDASRFILEIVKWWSDK